MKRVTTAIQGYGINLLGSHLSDRTKRLMFLASFSARAKEIPSFDKPTLQKLNKLMKLCNDESALKFPILISRAIWHGRTFSEICGDAILEGALTPARLSAASQTIISMMPAWLKYGDPLAIEKDVKQLLSNRQLLSA